MAAISAIYEITKIDQGLFIVTIPTVYQMLCETNNNWVLIKVIKLFIEFCQVEPRLLIKLKNKLCDLLGSQKAKSVQYEVIKAILKIYKDVPADDVDIYGIALNKLNSEFIE